MKAFLNLLTLVRPLYCSSHRDPSLGQISAKIKILFAFLPNLNKFQHFSIYEKEMLYKNTLNEWHLKFIWKRSEDFHVIFT